MHSSPKKVFITGISGFIGANLARKLINENHEVHAVIRPDSNLWRIKDIKEKINLYEVDILDQQALSSTIHQIKPNLIFHLAAYGSYPFQKEPSKIIDVNINGAINILNATLDLEYESLILTGTSSEYGIKENKMRETDILEPLTFYAASKGSATLLAQVFAKQYKKPINILRPFSVYGPYEEPTRFIPTIINALINKTDINLTPGEQRRDFIYIEDMTDAYMFLAKQNSIGEIFNIGTGNQFTNDEVVDTLFKITDKNTNINKGTYEKRTWDTSNWVADISKIKNLGWEPKFSLEEGLKKTFEFYNNEQF